MAAISIRNLDKAYGNTPQSPIGPNQVVVFDVQLVSIK